MGKAVKIKDVLSDTYHDISSTHFGPSIFTTRVSCLFLFTRGCTKTPRSHLIGVFFAQEGRWVLLGCWDMRKTGICGENKLGESKLSPYISYFWLSGYLPGKVNRGLFTTKWIMYLKRGASLVTLSTENVIKGNPVNSLDPQPEFNEKLKGKMSKIYEWNPMLTSSKILKYKIVSVVRRR